MGLLRTIYWKLYPGITNKVVYLKRQICGFNLTYDRVFSLYGLKVKEMDYNSEKDLKDWCIIMNDSYDDCYYNVQKARQFLSEHPLFANNKSCIFFDADEIPCASVSWGGIKTILL